VFGRRPASATHPDGSSAVDRPAHRAALRAIAAASRTPIAVVDADGAIVAASGALGLLCGQSVDRLDRTSILELVRTTDRPVVAASLTAGRPSRLPVHLAAWAGGEECELAIEPMPNGGAIATFEMTGARWAAQLDPITGLLTRRGLLVGAADIVAGTDRGDLMCVIVADLARRNDVNRILGHDAGDRLLSIAAEALRTSLPVQDLVARISADTFAVVSGPHRDAASMSSAALMVQHALRGVVEVDRTPILMAARVGYAVIERGDVAVALQHAARACARAGSGTGAMAVMASAGDTIAPASLAIEAELRRAIDECAIGVAFQPIVSTADGSVVAFEALARWRHGAADVDPALFVRVAEDLGIVHELDRCVMSKAIAAAVAWQHALPGVGLHVNCSPKGLHEDPAIVDHVIAQCIAHGLDHTLVAVEITESQDLLDEPPSLRRLAQAGVRLVIDDLGAGSSSLRALRRLPIAEVKLDRALVQPIDRSIEDEVIARGVTALAHALDVSVVAEGIETDEQLEAARRTGCDLVQGYAIARPMTLTDVLTWRFDRPRVARSAELAAPVTA
jgi:diguanylate cyclase (GGDEF)-like protein